MRAAVEIFWRELAVLGSRGFIPPTSGTRSTCTSMGRWSWTTSCEAVRPLEEANQALDDLKAGRVFRSVLAPT